jgi:hypothetical protein
MACETIFDAWRQATEFLGPDLYRRASYNGIWINLIPREEYKRGSGINLSTFTIERSEPTSDEETWPKVSFSNGDAGSCVTTYNSVEYGHTERTYAPEQFGLQGPPVCVDDLIFNWNTDNFLDAYMMQLAKRSRRSLENRLMAIYSYLVDKNVTNSSFEKYNGGTGTLPTGGPSLTGMAEPTCEMSQEMLETVAAELNEEGATDPNSDGWITLGEDGPVYPLYIGQELSQRILRSNPELRQDYRDGESGEGENVARLLRRVGATKVIGNFRHVINLFPPRFNWTPTGGGNGTFTRIPTWVMPSKTKGTGAEINPAWRDAPYEGCYVLHPWVYSTEIVRPISASGDLNWKPRNYMGEWMWVTGGHKITPAGADCYDPLGKVGKHFAEYKHAPKPVFPKYGRMMFARRCPANEYECATCVS